MPSARSAAANSSRALPAGTESGNFSMTARQPSAPLAVL
jgi:hypothetical protein